MSRQKTKRRRTVKLPRRNATTLAPRTSDKKKIALLTRKLSEALEQQAATSRELSQALEQQTATSEVLGIISSSPSELEPVFQAMLANATRLCEASYGTLFLCEGDAVRVAALHGAVPAAFAAERQRVDKAADQGLGLSSRPVDDRRPDQDVVLSAVACEQRLERRQHGHEQGDPFVSSERHKRIG